MQKVDELRQQGNDCVKAGNYSEAVIHYTHAVQQDKTNHLLYSNRSLAFLKLDQYYFALEDAKEAIRLQPNWPKVCCCSVGVLQPFNVILGLISVVEGSQNGFNRKLLYGKNQETPPLNIAVGERTGLVVRASDSGSGDPGSILGRVGVLFP